MVTIKDDRKLTNKCSRCGCTLPKNHPHHWVCQRCWENIQIEKGHFYYVALNDRKQSLRRGKV